MMSNHYFSAQPTVASRPRTITVELKGTTYNVTTDNGIFSPDGVDKGTEILLRQVPDPGSPKNALDIGCGWGPLTIALASLAPAAEVYAVDVNERSLALTRQNAAALGLRNVLACLPDQVDPQLRFDLMWSNPPIRVGKDALHEILRTWLPRLSAEGTAYLVVQKNLGSDSLQRWIASTFPDFTVARYAMDKGFRILTVSRT